MSLADNKKKGDKIYATESYVWDGSSRPNVNDYVAPWAQYANLEEKNSLYEKNQHYNSAVKYAKTMLNAAISQYENDLAFWNEQDERNYTSPMSQSQRYEDAGYNLGYMYSQVDSGNSAVGYGQQSSDIETNDTSNKSVEQVTKVVTTAFNLATNLVKTGFDLRLIDAQTSLAKWNKAKSIAEGQAISLQNQWTNFLRTSKPDGSASTDFSDSLAFLSEKLGYELNDNELTRLKTFVKYCDQIYSNQSQDMLKQLYENVNTIISDVDSPAIQAILRLLAIACTTNVSK